MVRMFRTSDGAIHEIQEPQDGCWIALTNPTATEIFEISEQFQIEVDDLRAPLDEEERSRIEVEDTYTLSACLVFARSGPGLARRAHLVLFGSCGIYENQAGGNALGIDYFSLNGLC